MDSHMLEHHLINWCSCVGLRGIMQFRSMGGPRDDELAVRFRTCLDPATQTSNDLTIGSRQTKAIYLYLYLSFSLSLSLSL